MVFSTYHHVHWFLPSIHYICHLRPFHDNVDRFDPEIHSEVGAAGRLLAGDRCRVIFPSAMVKGLPRSGRSETDEDRPLTKRYVLPISPPVEMKEMLA